MAKINSNQGRGVGVISVPKSNFVNDNWMLIQKLRKPKEQFVKKNGKLIDLVPKKGEIVKSLSFEVLNELFEGDYVSNLGDNNRRNEEKSH